MATTSPPAVRACRECDGPIEQTARGRPPARCEACRARREPVMSDRAASSVTILAQRVQEVALAYQAGDEPALRGELRALSAEAALLSKARPLLPSTRANRTRVAASP